MTWQGQHTDGPSPPTSSLHSCRMESPAELVFQNELLVRRILQFSPSLLQFFTASDHTMLYSGLQLRLVNSKFNAAVLFHIRKEYRSMTVTPSHFGAAKNDDGSVTILDIQNIQVNRAKFNTFYCEKFFQFLRVVPKVKVEHFRGDNLHMIEFGTCLNDKFCDGKLTGQYRVHKYITRLLKAHRETIRTFVGMSAFCHASCTFCPSLIPQCNVYGYWNAKNFHILPANGVKHFDTLFLNEIYSTSQALEFRSCDDKWIPPQIRCDKLIYHFPEGYVDGERKYIDLIRDPVGPFPLEAFRKALTVWKPKELTLTFKTKLGKYDNDPSIVEVSLDEPLSEDQKALIPNELDVVTLDLRDSLKLAFDLTKTFHGFNNIYSQVVSNIRQLIPCKKMIVEMREFSVHFTAQMRRFENAVTFPGLSDLLLKVDTGSERSFELNLTVYLLIPKENFEIGDRISLRDNWFTVSFPNNGKDRIMRLSCSETDCVINLDINFDKKELKEYEKSHCVEDMGIMKHFVSFLL